MSEKIPLQPATTDPDTEISTDTENSLEDELSNEEIPPEFRYHFNLKSEPDRYGTMGTADFDVDWRPQTIEFYYKWIPLVNNPDFDYFNDDHKRSLNAQLSRGSGRDMREFSIRDEEIIKKRNELLKELKDELNRLVEELQEKTPVLKIRMRVDKKSKKRSYENYHGDTNHEQYNEFTLAWDDVSNFSSPRTIASVRINKEYTSDLKADQEYFDALKEGNARATAYLRERMSKLEEAESSPEITDLVDQIYDLLDDIDLIKSTLMMSIAVYLGPKSMTEEDRAILIKKARSDEYNNSEMEEYRASDHTYPNPLDKVGTKGTREWFNKRGIDVDAEVINFSSSSR